MPEVRKYIASPGDAIGAYQSNYLHANNGFHVENGIAYNNIASFWEGLENKFTGNLDWKRELELLIRGQTHNAEEAQKARDQQEYLMRNSHQIEAEDLQSAGFNPALTLGSGGASAYSVQSSSGPSMHHTPSGNKGFDALMQLVIGLVSLGVNNARKVEALGQTLDLADKKLNAQIFQNDARLTALQAHWDSQDDYYGKRIKLGEARNSLAISDSYEKMKMDRSKFNANYARGYRV